MPRTTVHASDILAAKVFYEAERLGGLLYTRFADGLDHDDVASAIHAMAGDEHEHAGWYEAWLGEHGERPPSLAPTERMLVPTAHALIAPRSLDEQLRTFAKGEAAAAGHLESLAARIRDPDLRAIVQRTIPFERGHSEWFRTEARTMLRPRDFRRS